MNLVSRLMLVLGIAVAGATLVACQKNEQTEAPAAEAAAAPESAPTEAVLAPEAAPEAAPMEAAPMEGEAAPMEGEAAPAAEPVPAE